MTDQNPEEEALTQDAKTLWQAQPTAATPVSLAEIKRRARWSLRIIAMRNGADYLAYVVAVVWLLYGATYLFPHPALRIASAISVIVSLVACYLIWRTASAIRPPTEASAREFLAFQRAQIARQLHAVHRSWIWYLGPLVVIMAVFAAAVMVAYPTRKGLTGAAAYLVLTLLAIAVTLAINGIRARRLRRMLDEFESLEAAD